VKSKVLMVLIALTLCLSMGFAILTGCAGAATPKPTTPGATTAPPTTAKTTAPPTTTTAPAPTKAGQVYTLRWQTGWTTGTANWWCTKELAANLLAASGGRIVMDPLPVGSILNTQEIFDGVQTGAIEAGGPLNDCNYSGKDTQFELSCQPPGTFQAPVHLAYLFYGNDVGERSKGWTFRHNLFAKFNIYSVVLGNFYAEAEYLANKPLLKPADWKGILWRGTGMTTTVPVAFGAKGVNIPNQDLYSALQTGVVDAAELGTIYSNDLQGYYDITKYTAFPGIHKLSEGSTLLINMDYWKKLPPDLQKIIEMCCAYYSLRSYSNGVVSSAFDIDTVIKKGVHVDYESSDMQELWRSTSWKILDDMATKNPSFKEEWEYMKTWQITMDRYNDLETPRYGANYPGQMSFIPGIGGLTK